ncbi:MAG: neutral/alkaline non-lysosomal ceramidase N-terminal domain-containing protein, partial [Planctomycetota bacterium]
MKLLRVALVLAFIFSGMGWLQAEEANWQVGLARIDITPTRPILMDGYASRREPFEAVASPIHAKAIALKDEAGNRALLINAEILGFHDELSERIARRINESTGLPREAILISATHTHSGPMVLPIALGGEVPEAQWQEVLRYSRELEDKVVEISQKALQEMSPAQISWGVGSAPFVSNRREFTEKGVILGLNPEGPVDRSVPVLRVDGLDGNPSAVLFGTACHCTTLGGKNYHICGDYAGFAQDC